MFDFLEVIAHEIVVNSLALYSVDIDYKYLTLWQFMTGIQKIATPFSVLHAASLLSHVTRVAKFEHAIRQVVTNDSVVVDLGTGSGVLGILAARAGARRVIAIDVSADCVAYAERAAQLNGIHDRMEFVHCHFDEFVPDERADVVICEMLSSMMIVEQQVNAAYHAHMHILKPRGVFLPQDATVFVVPVECPSLWDRFAIGDLVFPRVPQTADKWASRDLADACVLQTFSFADPVGPKQVDKTVTFHIVDDGECHGILGMFESRLWGNIILQMQDGWRPLFLPFEEKIIVQRGDILSIRMQFRPGEVSSLKVLVEQ